jgi:DNA polymerase V
MNVIKLKQEPAIEFYTIDASKPLYLPFVGDISHGFPLPSDDYMDRLISLDEHLVKHPDATIYGKVKGHSMKDAGLQEGDVLIIDRSLKVENGEVGIFRIDGDILCKRLKIYDDRVELHPENKRFKPMVFDNNNLPTDFLAIGRVTYVIKKI